MRAAPDPAVRPRTFRGIFAPAVGDDVHVDAVDMGVPSLMLDLPAEPASIAEAISRVREFAGGHGAGAEGGAAIALAVGEAVGSAIRHAHPGDGVVQVMLDVEEGDLEFVVSHHARGVEVWMRFPLDR